MENLQHLEGGYDLFIPLCHEIGLEATILCSFFREAYSKNKEGFFCTNLDMQFYTALSKNKQTKALKKLKELNLIHIEKKDSSPKRFFHFNPIKYREICKKADLKWEEPNNGK